MHIRTLHETHNTLVPPQTTHGGTLCTWVGWSIFLGEEGAVWELKWLSAGLCLLSDLFWNLSDLQRLAHTEGVVLFGKGLWIFWQNRGACCSLLFGLMSWRFDGKRVPPEELHQCWVTWTHLFLFQGNGSWTLGEGVWTERGLLRSLYILLIQLDTQWSPGIDAQYPCFNKVGVKVTYSCPVSPRQHSIDTTISVTWSLTNKKSMYCVHSTFLLWRETKPSYKSLSTELIVTLLTEKRFSYFDC